MDLKLRMLDFQIFFILSNCWHFVFKMNIYVYQNELNSDFLTPRYTVEISKQVNFKKKAS